MSHSSVGEPSSQNIHPFFARGPASRFPAVPTSQPSAVDDALDTTTDAHESDPPTKRQKSEHISSYRVDSEVRNPSPVPATCGSSWMRSSYGQNVIKVTDQWQTSDAIQSQKQSAERGFPTLSHKSSSARSTMLASESTSPTAQHSGTTSQSSSQKVLKLNARTGTLGSPPQTQRKRKSSRIVCLRFGKDEMSRKEIGEKIAQILKGVLQLAETPLKQRTNSKHEKLHEHVANSPASKSTHPFFIGKSKPRSSTPNRSTDAKTKPVSRKYSIFMSTPVSPQKARNPFVLSSSNNGPQFGIKSRGTKIPGAKFSMWPAKGMSHVRGDDDIHSSTEMQQSSSASDKKSKGQVTTISPNESVLAAVIKHVNVQALLGNVSQEDHSFTPAPPELRLPNRHFESGLKLQHRIRSQLSVTSPLALAGKEDLSQDELAGPVPPAAHPAITQHFTSLAKQLSAFDRSTCESMAWNQKYAPVSAAQVLQRGKDAFHIKQWLEAMKVQSVETGISDKMGDKNRSKADAAPKKRRKRNKADEFIVDTEDEARELEEISEPEDEDDDCVSWRDKKSVMRPGNIGSQDLGRLKNGIVLSGPHGCGKTAAIYAIAKELDFEIFEINSGSRRSGKDVLDKVGDMTRNHLVQQHRAQLLSANSGSSDDTADKESKSSKQRIMTAFFKSKPELKVTTKRAPKKTATSKAQRQSLILIEEVDVLYEEDKQFWATLMSMMSQSRRPFVVTCNDESLIPLQSLNLHGIFRFGPAPIPSAVDLCILIAANEGHALRRGAVESLYRSRNLDLRATISDLNFWCQVGVGDRRGGFDWFYPRWPQGCDLDERGDIIRVISQDTYRHGMGWFGRDPILSEGIDLDKEMEVLQQSWNFWQVDLGDWCRSSDMSTLAEDMSGEFRTSFNKRAMALEAFDKFYHIQSDADLFSSGAFATQLQEQIDPTLPEMTASARDDFILGRTLLDAQEVSHYAQYNQEISLLLKSGARHELCLDSSRLLKSSEKLGLFSLDESAAVAKLDASFDDDVQDVTRKDIACAFDPIAVTPKAQPTSHLDLSVFDRTMRLIVVDVAPWVRGIVAFEYQLMQERQKLNNLLSEGSTRKRMRNTRSAYSALEGGERRSTRKERYFGDSLTTNLVMQTGGSFWQAAVAESMEDGRMETGRAHSRPFQGSSPQ